MFDDWIIWGSVIALSIILIVSAQLIRKTSHSCHRKIKYVHVNHIKFRGLYHM